MQKMSFISISKKTTEQYYYKGSFKFEGKLKEGVNQSYKQMLNLMKNAIPMMFRREEGGLEKKYHDSIMNNGDVGVFIQALHYGKPEAMKLWPKVEKIVKKNLDNFYKEDVKEKQKENTERNKLWMMLGKYAKKLKVLLNPDIIYDQII